MIVGEVGSFRKAAASLGVGQSAITRRVQKLEEILGVSLFERNPTGARLTIAGWNFTARSRVMLKDLRCAMRSAQCAGTGINGQLRLGLIASLSKGLLRDVVGEFMARHPDVRMKFVECDRSELLTMLSHRLIDVMFAAGAPPSEHGDMALISEEPIFFAVSQRHPLTTRLCVGWNDVEDQIFLTSSEEPGPEIREYMIARTGGLGRRPRMIEHRMDREGIMNLVGLGFGVSLVADHWRGTSYPSVEFLPVTNDGKPECIPFSLTWRPENDNPALRRFLSLARSHSKTNIPLPQL